MALVESTPFGPGSLTIGDVGTPQDFSVQTQACAYDVDKDQADPVVMLDGSTAQSAPIYKYKLTGTIRQDIADAAGVVAYTHTHAGEELPFTFTPVTAAACVIAGNLIVDPLKIGGETGPDALTSDFEFACVGKPDTTFGP